MNEGNEDERVLHPIYMQPVTRYHGTDPGPDPGSEPVPQPEPSAFPFPLGPFPSFFVFTPHYSLFAPPASHFYFFHAF